MQIAKTPALFVGHGSPMNAIDPENMFNRGFADIVKRFDKPRAVLCISAHWYSSRLQVQSGAAPEMIYDFHGFPEALYQVQYPAQGSPTLAQRVAELLAPETVHPNPTRGYDHGAWAVLKHLYPGADIPVVQLSLDRTQPAPWHWQLAKKLRPLRDEGVLILGSGDIVHNLGAIDWARVDEIGAGFNWAFAFRDGINRAIVTNDEATLIDFNRLGDAARLSVPTPDHYLPLLYVMAQRNADDPVTLFNDELMAGSISMTSVLVG